jgi:hypothetical protein
MQEQREHILHLLLLALGVAAFGLLAGITLTGRYRCLAVAGFQTAFFWG